MLFQYSSYKNSFKQCIQFTIFPLLLTQLHFLLSFCQTYSYVYMYDTYMVFVLLNFFLLYLRNKKNYLCNINICFPKTHNITTIRICTLFHQNKNKKWHKKQYRIKNVLKRKTNLFISYCSNNSSSNKINTCYIFALVKQTY